MMPDRIEAATYLVAGIITGGKTVRVDPPLIQLFYVN